MVFLTVRSLASCFRTLSYSAMAFCNFPCWTNFSAELRTFCLLKPKPNAISFSDSRVRAFRRACGTDGQLRGGHWVKPRDGRSDMVIVRLASQIRMVTKGYRRGVYDRVLGRF